MKNVIAGLAVFVAALGASPAVHAQEVPYQVAYFYKVRWGFQQEFERLFFKNHYPILMVEKQNGRIRDVQVFRPTFHGEGRADWTFMTVITFTSWQALGAPSEEEAIARRLFPEQEAFRKEEARRFEIIDAHWDVPLVPVRPPQ